MFFLLRYPQARIEAFEPDPEVFAFLQANVRACGAPHGVKVHSTAIYTSMGEITFEMEGADGGRVTNESAPGRKSRVVPTVRLRDLLMQPIDFLKLDIEGAEFDVLLDCADRLSLVKNCFVEMHGRPGEPSRFGEAISLLEKAGFRIQIHVPFSQRRPFYEHNLSNGMDLQLNVYGCRPQDS
ncbi:MAG: FkbM family methyltransferase [Verrucomicrobia bacterium]|nr:FkbM family methyltransferase [Verrucomicrobiota bacterium]